MKQIGLALLNHESTYKRFPLLTSGPSSTGPGAMGVPIPSNVYLTAPGSGATLTATLAPAGYSWFVKILPYLESSVTYTNISTASNKFTLAAFSQTGGPNGTGMQYLTGGGGLPTNAYRHFCTIALDEVSCPSFAGDSPTPLGLTAGLPYYATGAVQIYNAAPNPPWSAVITNYKAMAATHFACMGNPMAAPIFGGGSSNAVENANGILVPPQNTSSKGTAIRSITDGTSKTIIVAESKEQVYSSWYDGTLSWVVATPLDNRSSPISSGPSDTTFPPQPYKIMIAAAALGGGVTTNYWHFPETTIPGPYVTGVVTGLNYGKNPNGLQFFNQTFVTTPSLAVTTPTSYKWQFGPSSDHGGNIVLHTWADAHVSSITDDCDPDTYIQLCTKSGQEPVSDPGQ
jgi:hypothetical protein